MLIRAYQQATCIANLGCPCPVADMINIFLSGPDDMACDFKSQGSTDLPGGLTPFFAANARQKGELPAAAKIKRGDLRTSITIKHPNMWQTRAGPGGRGRIIRTNPMPMPPTSAPGCITQ